MRDGGPSQYEEAKATSLSSEVAKEANRDTRGSTPRLRVNLIWKSDISIVAGKFGNANGAKGDTGIELQVTLKEKYVIITRREFLHYCLGDNQGKAILEEPRAGNSHAGICGGFTLQLEIEVEE